MKESTVSKVLQTGGRQRPLIVPKVPLGDLPYQFPGLVYVSFRVLCSEH
jgi:hypothetical protein